MRVTNKQTAVLISRELFESQQRLLDAQIRLATGKKINKPSDDPIGMGKVLDYRNAISSIDQYSRNIDTAKRRIEVTDTLLENLHDLMGEVKNIAAEHSGGELTPELRQIAVQQVEGLYDQILTIANTKYNANYLFAGHDTDTIPFPRDEVTTGAESTLSGGVSFDISSSTTDYYVWYDIDNGSTDPAIAGSTGIEVDISAGDTANQVAAATQTAINANADFSATVINSAVKITSSGESIDAADNNSGFSFHNATYNGDNGLINLISGENEQVRINLTGNEVFTGVGVTNGTNIFADLKALKDALEAVPYDASVVSGLMDNMTNGENQVEGAEVTQSITYKRLETTENHWDKFKNNVIAIRSKIEDVDIAQAIIELQVQETAYTTNLETSSMIVQRSLIDYIR